MSVITCKDCQADYCVLERECLLTGAKLAISKDDSKLIERLKPVIGNARRTYIREKSEKKAGRRQYSADIDQAIAEDVIKTLKPKPSLLARLFRRKV